MNWDNKDNDPWGNKNDAPDFDELIKKFSSILGGKKSSSNGSDDGSGNNFSFPSSRILMYALFGFSIVYASQCIYQLDASERAVILRFGKFYEEQDIHIHVPEGATPKDGPSAGAAMATALTSVLSKIPVRSDVAMTGEITLRGEVLKIGGLKEKLLAARRGGIKVVLIPEGNVRDLKEIPDNIKADLDIKPVRWIDEVLDIVLTRQPIPWEKDEQDEKVPSKKSKTKKSSVKAH